MLASSTGKSTPSRTSPECLANANIRSTRRECYCGNTIASDATANANGCTLTCMGKTTEYCGGSFQMNVYKLIKASSPSTISKTSASSTAKSSSTLSTSTISLSQTTPSATGTPTSGFYSLGCYAEPSGPTPKPWAQILASDNMSPEACISAAQAKLTANPPVTYRVLGLEYGRECWGQTAALTSQTSLVGNLACPSTCAGDKSKSCGGNNMFNYYATTSGLGTSTAPVAVRTTGTVKASTTAKTQ